MIGLLAAMPLPIPELRIQKQVVVIDEFSALARSDWRHPLVAPLEQGRTSGRGADIAP
jgi:hypothetical protein